MEMKGGRSKRDIKLLIVHFLFFSFTYKWISPLHSFLNLHVVFLYLHLFWGRIRELIEKVSLIYLPLFVWRHEQMGKEEIMQLLFLGSQEQFLGKNFLLNVFAFSHNYVKMKRKKNIQGNALFINHNWRREVLRLSLESGGNYNCNWE